MDSRVLLFLFVVGSCWCCNARDLTANHVAGNSETSTGQHVNDISENERLCSLCEEFVGNALNYLSENKTQTEILDILHKSCSKLPSFKQQCIVLVDYYAPLFFLEVSSIQADGFCRKVDLCEDGVFISHHLSQDKCDMCHNVVTEALLKLKDPDTELEIVQLLLKVCNSIGNSVKKGNKVDAMLYRADVDLLKNFLRPNETYLISNAVVRPVNPGFKNSLVDNNYQWIISAKTAILPTEEKTFVSSALAPVFTLHYVISRLENEEKNKE
ncbi:hypothetical protein OROMI_006887 [Orobanche minor]